MQSSMNSAEGMKGIMRGMRSSIEEPVQLGQQCHVSKVLWELAGLLTQSLHPRKHNTNEVLIALECCNRTTSDHAQAVSNKGEALPVWRQTSSWILALTTIKSSRDHVITPPSGTGWRRLTSSEGGRVIGDLHRMLS